MKRDLGQAWFVVRMMQRQSVRMVDDVGCVTGLLRGLFEERHCCYEIAFFQSFKGLFVTHAGIVDWRRKRSAFCWE